MSDYNQVRSINLGIAEDTSIEAAMIYDDLAYAQKSFGKGYFYRSDEQMLKRFPIFSKSTIRRHVKLLVDGGWISTKVMKVGDRPVLNYQIEQTLNVQNDQIHGNSQNDQIHIKDKETKKETKNIDPLLISIIDLVNPKEKPTDDRRRQLRARLKDYTEAEILGAARALSQSEWHREHKQMSVDNLLAPSKFGRWYAQRTDQAGSGDAYGFKNGKKIVTRDNNDNAYWGGELITPQNQDRIIREQREQN